MTNKILELKMSISPNNKMEWIRNKVLEKIKQWVHLEKFPSRLERSEEYGAHFIAIQNSITSLIKSSLINIKKGRGTYINAHKHYHCTGILGSKNLEECFFDEICYCGTVPKHIFKNIFNNKNSRIIVFSIPKRAFYLLYSLFFRNTYTIDDLIVFAPYSKGKRIELYRRHPYVVVDITIWITNY